MTQELSWDAGHTLPRETLVSGTAQERSWAAFGRGESLKRPRDTLPIRRTAHQRISIHLDVSP